MMEENAAHYTDQHIANMHEGMHVWFFIFIRDLEILHYTKYFQDDVESPN